jgi:hypothetical protein
MKHEQSDPAIRHCRRFTASQGRQEMTKRKSISGDRCGAPKIKRGVPKIKAVSVTRYRDNGQTVACVEWADGTTTQGNLKRVDAGPRKGVALTFGSHLHALFARAKREGLRTRLKTAGDW